MISSKERQVTPLLLNLSKVQFSFRYMYRLEDLKDLQSTYEIATRSNIFKRATFTHHSNIKIK